MNTKPLIDAMLQARREAWARRSSMARYLRPSFDNFQREELVCELQAFIVAAEAAGWKFVPMKATKEMIGAGYMKIPEWDTIDHIVAAAKVLDAGIAAAPKLVFEEQKAEEAVHAK